MTSDSTPLQPQTILIDEQTIQLTEAGYLCQFQDWNEQVAIELAKRENINLTPPHWEILHFLRDYYQRYHDSPAVRALVKALKERFGEQIGNSIYLHQLFPDGPAKQASKLAGLPKPKRCL